MDKLDDKSDCLAHQNMMGNVSTCFNQTMLQLHIFMEENLNATLKYVKSGLEEPS